MSSLKEEAGGMSGAGPGALNQSSTTPSTQAHPGGLGKEAK